MTALLENEQPRLEVKLACSAQSYPSVISALRSGPTSIRPLYPTRIVQSLYFDTHDGHALSENLSGQSSRRKYRLRWYGRGTTPEDPTLECKIRENRFGTKKRTSIPGTLALEGTPRQELMRTIITRCPSDWQEELFDKEPVQWIEYERAYYCTWDQHIRITVDQHLQAFDQRYTPDLTRTRKNIIPHLTIIELKAAPDCEHSIQKIVSTLPAGVDKCSKFVLASAPTQAPDPSFWEYV